jgi:hypothetical protein
MRRTPQQPGEAQAPQATGELEESCEDSTGGGGAAHRLSDRSDVYMCETV